MCRKTLILVASLVAVASCLAQSAPRHAVSLEPDVQFSGEVTRGQSFEHAIGHGLKFRLTSSPGGVDVGWEIEIVPVAASGSSYAYQEFSGIATPPYHSYNQRYLETSYGMKSQEAVGITPRDFQFAQSAADSDAAKGVVDDVLSSPNFPDHVEGIASAAEKIPVGTGELRILDSRVTPGEDDSSTGTINWIRFSVTLNFNSHQTLKDVPFPRSAVLTSSTAPSISLVSFKQAPPPLTANGVGQGGQADISCRAFPEQTTESFKRKLWDGYEISLGPTPNAAEDAGNNCTAAIYNAQTRVVYRTTGFNVVFDQNLTGQDFDGDGHPEVVFQTDTGGGNHCCWAYNVVSLYPRPHKLFDIGQEGADQFEKDANGKMVIWTRVEAPDVFNSSMADRPFAERVYRIQNGKMVDSTPEFCLRIFGPQSRDNKVWNAVLSPANLSDLGSVDHPGPDQDHTAHILLERAYQHVLCHDYSAAIADLDLWPAASRLQMKADFARQIRDDFPDFAAQLTK